jgi:signal transduction histidine kinase
VTRRLVASWVSLALVVLLALEVPLAISYARNQRSDALTRLEHDATAVGALAADALRGSGSRSALAGVVRRYGDETDGEIVVVDRGGHLVVGVAGASTRNAVHALAGRVVRTTGNGALSVAVPVTSGGKVLGAAGVSTPSSDVNGTIASFRWRLVAVGAAVLAVTILAAFLLSRWVTRPLRTLERVAERVGEGELDARAPVGEGPPEVRSLSRRFNETVGKLETLVRAQESFAADASHQLRTPLTALRLRLENGDLDEGLREVDRLARIVDALLALARSEAAPPEAVELSPAVAERLDAWQPVADSERVRLEADVSGSAHVGRDRLGQVLDNLLANAIEAAPTGSVVSVTGNPRALHVRDHGRGMSEAERARAFDRFWSKGAGSGLGLAIVKRLVELDGGSIDLEQPADGGLEVVLHLEQDGLRA